MSNPTSILIAQETRKFQSRLTSAISMVDRSRDVIDVVRLHDVHVPGWLRSMVARERNALSAAAERKVATIVEERLKQLHTADGQDRTVIMRQLQQDHRALCGHFPRTARDLYYKLLQAKPPIQQGESDPIEQVRFR